MSDSLESRLTEACLQSGLRPKRLRVESIPGRSSKVIVIRVVEVQTHDDPEMSRMERKIIEVLETLGPGDSLLGREIASEAEYMYSGKFRACVSAMAKAKKIRKIPDGGYALFSSEKR